MTTTERRASVAIVGLGTMGCGIAVGALTHGIDVVLLDIDEAATAAGRDRLSRRLNRHVQAGLLPSSVLASLDGAVYVTSYDEIGDGVDFIIEAVPEDWTIKRGVLAALSASSSVRLATNTSSFPVDQLASSVTDATRFIGVHFFNPAEWTPGVEVVNGAHTAEATTTAAIDLLRRMAKNPTVVRSSPGFLANRLQLALFSECMRVVDEGLATAEDVDRIVRSTFGFRLPAFGPFAVADMAGLDVYESILDTLADAFGERFAAPESLRSLVARGRHGLKTGAGFRDYTPGEVEELLAYRDSQYARIEAATNSGVSGGQTP